MRMSQSDAAKTTALPTKMPMFAFRLSYIFCMKPSMTTAIVAPMTNAM